MPASAKAELRKALAKSVREIEKKEPSHRVERAKTRLDASTQAAIAYVAGLYDPFGAGVGVRKPDDGMTGTDTMSAMRRAIQYPIASSTAGSSFALWAYAIYPDFNYAYKTVTSFTTPGGVALTWGAFQAAPTQATLAASSAVIRGATNCGVKVSYTGAAVARGGSFVQAMLPPGGVDGVGGLPTTLDQIFSAPGAYVEPIDQGSHFYVKWKPASDDSVALSHLNTPWRTGTTWVSPAVNQPCYGDNVIIIAAYTPIGYNGAAPVVGAVDLSAMVSIMWNTEFHPLFGANEQIFPCRLVAGDTSDVAKVLKPVLATEENPVDHNQISPDRLRKDIYANDALARLGGLGAHAAKVGGSFLDAVTDISKRINRSYGIGGNDFTPAKLLSGALGAKQAGWDVMDTLAEMASGLFVAQHRTACYLGVPYVSPINNYARGEKHYRNVELLGHVDFMKILAAAVTERAQLPANPLSDLLPPVGSAFIATKRAPEAADEKDWIVDTPPPSRASRPAPLARSF